MYVHTYVLLSSTYLLLQFLFLVFDIIWSDSIITMIFTCQSVTIKMHRTQTDSIFNSTHGVWSFCFLHVTFGHTYFLYKIPQKWLAFFCSNWGLLCKNDVSLFNDWPKSVYPFLTFLEELSYSWLSNIEVGSPLTCLWLVCYTSLVKRWSEAISFKLCSKTIVYFDMGDKKIFV